jgi:UDP-N-acetylglucosamine 2-epimerase (non-hydrolysing)
MLMNTPLKTMLIVGARPNFMKSAPLMAELRKHSAEFAPILVHTGQHYDHNLSQLFFEQLGMVAPDIYLGIGSDTQAKQTARMMIELDTIFDQQRPDLVIVFGDVNSTMAAAIVASKLNIKIAHVESGLRSFDMTMPEEINRIVTDRLSEYLFITEKSAQINLEREGADKDKVFFVGNIMIDSLVTSLEKARQSQIVRELGMAPGSYALMTLHRPAGVDNEGLLAELLKSIEVVSRKIPVIFPCHPRTRKHLENINFAADSTNMKILEPLGYLDFLSLQANAKLVLTDSGGVQEETTYLGIPCITIRENTERPITAEIGTNVIVGLNPKRVVEEADKILAGTIKKGKIPELWDGHTAGRIVDVLKAKCF